MPNYRSGIDMADDVIYSHGTNLEDLSFLENHKGAGDARELADETDDLEWLEDALIDYDAEQARRHKEDDFTYSGQE